MSRVRTWAARLARGHTRLAVRLFLFNALLVFLPVAGLWYLDAYEQHLLEQQERAMVQQARLLAAVLAESPDLSAIGSGSVRSGCSIAWSSRPTSVGCADRRVVSFSAARPRGPRGHGRDRARSGCGRWAVPPALPGDAGAR
jgi:hypothetical protein